MTEKYAYGPPQTYRVVEVEPPFIDNIYVQKKIGGPIMKVVDCDPNLRTFFCLWIEDNDVVATGTFMRNALNMLIYAVKDVS